MDQSLEVFCFTIDNHRYGFPLSSVDRIIQAVAVHSIPNSPPLIYGLFDFYGSLVPVINLRYRLKLPDLPIRVSDYFVIVDTTKRKLAIVIDEVDDSVISSARELVPSARINEGLETSGFIRRDDGMIFIYDLETFISNLEDDLIQEVMDNASI